jgi:hypothetical protein
LAVIALALDRRVLTVKTKTRRDRSVDLRADRQPAIDNLEEKVELAEEGQLVSRTTGTAAGV